MDDARVEDYTPEQLRQLPPETEILFGCKTGSKQVRITVADMLHLERMRARESYARWMREQEARR